MPVPKDKELYLKVKKMADEIYKKSSAYKSGYIIKKYKEMGGDFTGKKNKGNLYRWFNEEWKDINPNKSKDSYPVYRPTKRVNEKTPLTVSEIPKKRIVEQSILKQKIKGKKNLPKF